MLTRPHFSPIFCSRHDACSFTRPVFRSLVRSEKKRLLPANEIKMSSLVCHINFNNKNRKLYCSYEKSDFLVSNKAFVEVLFSRSSPHPTHPLQQFTAKCEQISLASLNSPSWRSFEDAMKRFRKKDLPVHPGTVNAIRLEDQPTK